MVVNLNSGAFSDLYLASAAKEVLQQAHIQLQVLFRTSQMSTETHKINNIFEILIHKLGTLQKQTMREKHVCKPPLLIMEYCFNKEEKYQYDFPCEAGDMFLNVIQHNSDMCFVF